MVPLNDNFMFNVPCDKGSVFPKANSNVDEGEARYKATVQKGNFEFRKSGWAVCFVSVILQFELNFDGFGDVRIWGEPGW